MIIFGEIPIGTLGDVLPKKKKDQLKVYELKFESVQKIIRAKREEEGKHKSRVKGQNKSHCSEPSRKLVLITEEKERIKERVKGERKNKKHNKKSTGSLPKKDPSNPFCLF